MTNQQIIFNAQLELMEQGIIGSTGRMLTFEKEDGSKVVIPEPEPIHTYAVWKDMGYQVGRGQKAVAAITIWKHADASKRTDKESGEEFDTTEKMFMKTAYFFKRDQCESIAETA